VLSIGVENRVEVWWVRRVFARDVESFVAEGMRSRHDESVECAKVRKASIYLRTPRDVDRFNISTHRSPLFAGL